MAGGVQGPFVPQNIGFSGPNIQVFSGSVPFGDRQLQQILADVNLLLAPLQQQLPYFPTALDFRAWQPWPPVTYIQPPVVQYPPFQQQKVAYYPPSQYMNLSYPPLPVKSVFSRPVHAVQNPPLQVSNHQKLDVAHQKAVPDEPPPPYTYPSEPVSVPAPVKTSSERETQGLPPSYEETIAQGVKTPEAQKTTSLYPDLPKLDDYQPPDIAIPKVVQKQSEGQPTVQPKEQAKPPTPSQPLISESMSKKLGGIKIGPPVKKPKPKRGQNSKTVREHKPAPLPPSKPVLTTTKGSPTPKDNKENSAPEVAIQTPAPSVPQAPPPPPPLPPIGGMPRKMETALPKNPKFVTEEKTRDKPSLPQGERPFKANDLQDQWEKIKAKSKNKSVSQKPERPVVAKSEQEKLMDDLTAALKRRRQPIAPSKGKNTD